MKKIEAKNINKNKYTLSFVKVYKAKNPPTYLILISKADKSVLLMIISD
jgi:hypothetical protein